LISGRFEKLLLKRETGKQYYKLFKDINHIKTF